MQHVNQDQKKKKLLLLAEAGMPRHGDHLLMPLAQWCQFFLGLNPVTKDLKSPNQLTCICYNTVGQKGAFVDVSVLL